MQHDYGFFISTSIITGQSTVFFYLLKSKFNWKIITVFLRGMPIHFLRVYALGFLINNRLKNYFFMDAIIIFVWSEKINYEPFYEAKRKKLLQLLQP